MRASGQAGAQVVVGLTCSSIYEAMTRSALPSRRMVRHSRRARAPARRVTVPRQNRSPLLALPARLVLTHSLSLRLQPQSRVPPAPPHTPPDLPSSSRTTLRSFTFTASFTMISSPATAWLAVLATSALLSPALAANVGANDLSIGELSSFKLRRGAGGSESFIGDQKSVV